MTTTRKYRLNSMPGANCHVVFEHDSDCDHVTITLVSWDEPVVRLFLSRTGNRASAELWARGTYGIPYGKRPYSSSTSRHINRFTTEFCGASMYHIIKSAVESKYHGNQWISIEDIDHAHALSTAVKYFNNSFAFGNVKKFTGRY